LAINSYPIGAGRRRWKGLLLASALTCGTVSAQQAAPGPIQPTLDVQSFKVEGDVRLSPEEVAQLLAPFVGEKRTLTQIDDAAHALEKTLHDRGYLFYRVLVPAQKPVGGEVVLQVISFTLGRITVTGNEHFSNENIRRSLPDLQEGVTPDMLSLGRDLTAANANPAKQASVTFREGTQPETVDADVKIKDTDPLNFFVDYSSNRSVDPLHGADNLYRATFGIQDSNLFDRDQVVTVSYTTDPQNPADVDLFGAFYQIPVYGTGLSVSIYYTHSDVNSGNVQQGGGFFDVTGKGEFYGVRVTDALPRLGSAQQTISVSLDEHYYENTTTFLGTQIQPNVGARPLTVAYNLHQDQAWGNYGANIAYVTNLGGGAGDTSASYSANNAEHDWDAIRYGADATYNYDAWNFTVRLRGQWSSHPLIAGEQFGLGGLDSVRGFLDREVAGDSGYSWNLEALAPAALLPRLRPFVFIDGGEVHSNSTQPSETLLSTGFGVRWSLGKFDAVADLAQVLERNTLNPVNVHTRMNLLLSYRF
jgi:hemolysin activation/secretion protein